MSARPPLPPDNTPHPVRELLMTGSFWAVLPYIFLVPAIWLWRRSDRMALEASARSHHHRGVAEGMAEAVAQLLARGVS